MHIAFEDTCRRNKPYESINPSSPTPPCDQGPWALSPIDSFRPSSTAVQSWGSWERGASQLGFRLREFAELLGHLSPGKLHALLWEELKSNLTFVGLKWIEASNLSLWCKKTSVNHVGSCGFIWLFLHSVSQWMPRASSGRMTNLLVANVLFILCIQSCSSFLNSRVAYCRFFCATHICCRTSNVRRLKSNGSGSSLSGSGTTKFFVFSTSNHWNHPCRVPRGPVTLIHTLAFFWPPSKHRSLSRPMPPK